MADKTKVHVVRGDGNMVESLTKEEILAAIVQAIETGEIGDVDTGFVTTVKEQNRNTGLKFWLGTQAEYNALQTIDPDTYYIITDDTFKTDVGQAIAQLQTQMTTNSNQVTENTDLLSQIFETSTEGTRTAYFITSGFLTGGKRTVSFTVPLEKFVPDTMEIDEIVSVNAVVRQNGNYIVGTSSFYAPFLGTFSFQVVGNSMSIEYQDTEDVIDVDHATNNAPVGVAGYVVYSLAEAQT